MTKRQRRDREHALRHYPLKVKLNRSRRARGKTRVRILGDQLNHRGRFAYVEKPQ